MTQGWVLPDKAPWTSVLDPPPQSLPRSTRRFLLRRLHVSTPSPQSTVLVAVISFRAPPGGESNHAVCTERGGIPPVQPQPFRTRSRMGWEPGLRNPPGGGSFSDTLNQKRQKIFRTALENHGQSLYFLVRVGVLAPPRVSSNFWPWIRPTHLPPSPSVAFSTTSLPPADMDEGTHLAAAI